MADVTWPTILRPAAGGNPEPSFATVSGPASTKGRAQVIASDAGFWTVKWGGVPLYTPEQWRAYSATRVLLNGRVNRAEIPIFVLGIQRWPDGWGRKLQPPRKGPDGPAIYVTNNANIAIGAMAATLRAKRGTVHIEAGSHFSRLGRLYIIQKVLSRTRQPNDEFLFSVQIWPPVREAIGAGAALEFDRPTLWAKLQTDDEMSAGIDPAYQGSFDVNWREDV